jgi:hypothetical protein
MHAHRTTALAAAKPHRVTASAVDAAAQESNNKEAACKRYEIRHMRRRWHDEKHHRSESESGAGKADGHSAAPELVRIDPQVFDLLIYLIENRHRVVSKDDMLAGVWGGGIVSESTLASRINAARNAIGDDGKAQKLIRTASRKGFRFVGDGTPLAVDQAAANCVVDGAMVLTSRISRASPISGRIARSVLRARPLMASLVRRASATMI